MSTSSFLRRTLLALAALAGTVGTTGCATLGALGIKLQPPQLTFQSATLAQSPSQMQLASYYCPRVLRAEGRLGLVSDALCMQLFGRPPENAQMQVAFDLNFLVANPNQIPLPLSELLTAVNVFPEATAQNLGVTCVKFCPPDDATCAPVPGPTSCRNAPGDIRTLDDFPRALANMVVGQGLATVAGEKPKFEVPKVQANESMRVTARFGFAPEALLPVLEQLARQAASELRRGQIPAFSIPYKLEGTLFADAGSLGRVAAPFGPTSGTWDIPRDVLIIPQ